MEREPGPGSMRSSGSSQRVSSGPAEPPIALEPLKRPPLSSSVGNGVGVLIFALVLSAFVCTWFVTRVRQLVEHTRIAHALAEDGRACVGRIVSLSEQSGEDETIFRICYAYAFAAPGSSNPPPQEYEACETQSGRAFESLRRGQKVSVLASAARPERAALAMGGRSRPLDWAAWLSPAVVLLFVLMSVGATSTAILGLINRRQLDRRGKLASAIVFDRWQEGSGEGTDDCVAYAFWAQPAAGEPVLVTRAERNAAAYRALTVGQRSPVRYLAESPSICELTDFL